MHHAHAAAIDRAQLVAPDALMKPNLLQQSLGRRGSARFAQAGTRVRALAPFLVKMGIEQSHFFRNSEPDACKVKDLIYFVLTCGSFLKERLRGRHGELGM
jgi:hypothetical protein